MNESTCESLMYFARFRETLLFLICIFFSWRIFECKKLLCQNSCTSFETSFVRVQKWAFSSIWSSRVARIFFLRSGDGVIDCEKVEVVWRERKKGTMQNNTWLYDCVFWEELMERIWWKGKKAGFGLCLALLYHLDLLLG